MPLQQIFDRATYNTLVTVPSLNLLVNPPLRVLGVEPTNDCQLRCRMCPVREREIGYMPLNLYRKVLSEAVKLKPDTLYLSYQGESFLHPQIDQFLKYGFASGIKNRFLFTNGMLVKSHLEPIAMYLTKIVFSLDGIGEVNNRIRVNGNYNVVIENIKQLQLIRKRIGSHIKIHVNLTRFTQTNIEVADFCREMSKTVDVVSVSECHDKNNHYVKKSDYGRVARYCAFPFNSMGILWDGSVTFCMLGAKNLPILEGINAQTHNLEKLWKSEQWRKIRQRLQFQGCLGCERGKQNRITVIKS